MPTANSLLRQERQLRGWSQVHLAKQIGVPDYYISRWERGEVLPSPFYQQKLCEIFGKTTQELGIFQAKEEITSQQDKQKRREETAPTSHHIDAIQENVLLQSPDLSFFSAPTSIPDPITPFPDSFPLFTPTATMSPGPSSSQKERNSSTTGPLQRQAPALELSSPTRSTALAASGHDTFAQRTHSKGFITSHSRFLFGVFVSFIVISVGLGASLQLIRGRVESTQTSSGVVQTNDGFLYFTSSGQTSEQSNQGIADQVELQLSHVPSSVGGKSDYVWLLPDLNQPEAPVTLLGKLGIQHGIGHLQYSDSQHSNLLSTNSRLLVTEEDSAIQPLTPSPDKHMWRYTATIAQNQMQDGHTFLDHLRHLLSDEPSIKARRLSGGLAIWFYRDMRDILEWSNSAREYWQGNMTTNTDFMRRQAIRVLEYLDGISNVTMDAPANKAFPILVDYRKGGIPILQLSQEQNPTGYLYHIGLHLMGLVAFSAASPELRASVSRIMKALDNMSVWLKQLRQDAHQIAAMSDSQLRQESTLPILNDMATNANYAYVGKEDAMTGTTQEGAEWLYNNILLLAKVGVQAVHA